MINKVKINTGLTIGHSPKLNILQLSDLHLENISISPIELYEKLKDEPIDLIALTGDFLDRKRTIPKLVPYLKILNQLHANMASMPFWATMIMCYAIRTYKH